MSVLSLNNICFSYDRTPVLQNISYDFEEGKMYCISGKSGAGKTTLLSVLSGLAEPNSGSICYDGNDIKKINKYTFRSKYIGVVFQSFNLVTKFTAVENVVLSMEIAGVKGINKKKKAYELLESVGLDTDEANRRVLKLSGGQQQRVAIGRALSYDAQVLLADEPTGNLDSDTQQDILQIFRSLADSGKCVILVSHSSEVAKACDQIYTLQRISGKSARR
ncbi:MAG: ABC transporter ATP-binding protein [Clostridiales bacterium]|nr:ABC transporter ATP-binding protein [Clostridiales bacterium]HCH67847.1 ABC transporter [Clostridiales bacterium]